MEKDGALFAYFSAYLHLEKNASPHTVLNYQADVRHFLEFMQVQAVGEEVLFSTVDLVTVRLYLAHLRNCGYAQSTVLRKVTCLRRFFHFLVQNGYLPENPFLTVTLPQRKERQSRRLLSEAELVELVEAPAKENSLGLRDKAILTMLSAAALRGSELVRLKIKDIDLRNGFLLIYGTESKERIVPFDAKVQETLQEYLEQSRTDLDPQAQETWLFLNHRGTQLTERSVGRIVAKYGSKLKLQICPKLIRASRIALLLKNGFKHEEIQTLVGNFNFTNDARQESGALSILQEYKKAHPRA